MRSADHHQCDGMDKLPCTFGMMLQFVAQIYIFRESLRSLPFFLHSSHSHMRTCICAFDDSVHTILALQLSSFLCHTWRKWRGIKDVKTSSPSLIPRPSYSFTRQCRMLSTCMNMSTCMNIQHMHCEEFPPSSSVRGLHHHVGTAHVQWRVSREITCTCPKTSLRVQLLTFGNHQLQRAHAGHAPQSNKQCEGR